MPFPVDFKFPWHCRRHYSFLMKSADLPQGFFISRLGVFLSRGAVVGMEVEK